MKKKITTTIEWHAIGTPKKGAFCLLPEHGREVLVYDRDLDDTVQASMWINISQNPVWTTGEGEELTCPAMWAEKPYPTPRSGRNIPKESIFGSGPYVSEEITILNHPV